MLDHPRGRTSLRRVLILPLLLVIGLAGCTASTAPAGEQAVAPVPNSPAAGAGARGPHGKLTIAWSREPDSLGPKFLGGAAGADYTWLFNSPLAYSDISGGTHPMLARE